MTSMRRKRIIAADLKSQAPGTLNKNMPRKAIFLDRDGVINHKLPEDHYVSSIEQFVFLDGVAEALRLLRDMGFVLVVITNQRGIARNLMTESDLEKVHNHMRSVLARNGVVLDAVYHCPHEKDELCNCRKPQPGMILQAQRDLGIDLNLSYLVGDSPSDMEAGSRAGVRSVRITDGQDDTAHAVFKDLLDFARDLANRQNTVQDVTV
ncbi:D,D-heptose 1,7-bisphosphate phosphatase [Desulfomonile tiedjei DSM 6799]|uniref:D,D-heptose 1,7-bisphosphate phosphatase n=2 Tax=Desulfomonile tiedjei TaxID=2358 RepID=I4CA81_DESTA|nr:D,D-heptose 1,7-bisphosphate phosphatase [Desulfomonile tiedjei DSM 6799]